MINFLFSLEKPCKSDAKRDRLLCSAHLLGAIVNSFAAGRFQWMNAVMHDEGPDTGASPTLQGNELLRRGLRIVLHPKSRGGPFGKPSDPRNQVNISPTMGEQGD
ncbi:hypothetical protein [Mesorhizobium loti]|uniref:hypothetical protein n=1 Tax=Rhizobium loti TaxID=381 RepID=UPI001267C053|nr:hypothetical protein [Mesorhizobium loti]